MAQTILLNILKIVMILLCSGWVFLWVLKPTRMWTRKWKEAEDALRPSFLGYYGLDFLVFTFPVISVAILGSIYTSLKVKKPKVRKPIPGLSNPVIVNTLVGTLSAMEILSVSLFAVFLAWTYYTRIANDFKKLVPIKTLSLETWQLKFLRVATRFGLLSEVCLALLLLPILRGLSVFNLIGVRFEDSVRYHVWLGTAMICFSTIHGLSTLFIWGVSHHIHDEIWKWQPKGRIYLAGEMGLVTGLVIWITSLPQIRRKRFEIFYYTHHLYVVFLVLFLFHAGDRHFYSVFGGIFLFGLDKMLRIVQSRPGTHVLSAKIFACKAIELVLPKDPEVKYRPTSMVFVKIPRISKLQWHSFSVTSSSSIDEHTMSVIVKCQGSWTNSLFEIINSELKSGSDTTNTINIAVEGPYGPSSTNFLGYDNLILIAGGVGVTPFLSIVQELASSLKNPSIELIYVVKKSQDICLLSSISHLLSHQPSERFDLKLSVYVTQEQRSGTTLRELLNKFSHVETVRFRPEDSSIRTIDGLKSYNSMALVAGLSSVLFLGFLVCFNHVFVPSLNGKSMKEAKEKTPSSVVDLVIIGSFIAAMAIVSLVAVVLRQMRSKSRSPKKQCVESQRESSVESGFGLDRHELHFTRRPNFQDIFEEFESVAGGSDIGVLVCGPEAMKESVAQSCRRNSRSFVNIGSEAKKKTKKTSFSFHSLSFDI